MDDSNNAEIATTAPEKPPRSRLRLARLASALVALFVLALLAALAFSIPQRWVIPRIAASTLGAEVSMTVRSTWSRVELGDILVCDPQAPELPPLIRAEALSMPWTLLGPRHVPSLCVTGLDVHMDGADPQHTNYRWVQRLLARPSSGWDLVPWTPVNVTVAPVRLAASLPGGSLAVEGVGVDGLVLTATTESLQRYKMGLVGDDAEIRWTLPGVAPQIFSKNALRVQVEADRADYAVAAELGLPHGDRVKGSLSATRKGPDMVVEVAVMDSVLRQPVWGEIAGAFLPARFVVLECPELRATLHRDSVGWDVDAVNLRSRIKGLTVGPVGTPWFFGDIQLATVDAPKDAKLAADAVVNDLPPARLTWSQRKEGWRLGASFEGWTAEQVAALLPTAMGATMLRCAPSVRFSGSADTGPTTRGWSFAGDVRAQSAERGGDPFSVRTKGAMAGTVVTAESKLSWGEGAAVEIRGLHYDRAAGRATAALFGSVDLASVAKRLGLSDLWGAAKVEGKLQCDAKGRFGAEPFRIIFETLGWGNLGIPYGLDLAVTAPVRRDESGMNLGPVKATLGADTELEVANIAWKEGVLSVSELDVETGLAPLVAKGWLAAAEGHAKARCTSWVWPMPGETDAIEYDASFARLDLADGWCNAKGFNAAGQLKWNGGAAGTGTIKAEEAVVAGATLRAVRAALGLYGSDVLVEDAAFGLFGGTVNGEARLTPLEPVLPVSFSLAVDKLDLEAFTREYKPPSTRLTGLVGGSVSASLDLGGLRALDVNLKSDGGVSMNRDLVERLLASQYLAGLSGGKQMSRMLRDAVGDKAEIFFSGATVRLGLEEGRISGVARLESEKLNLTLDIKADPGALLEMLRARSASVALEKADK